MNEICLRLLILAEENISLIQNAEKLVYFPLLQNLAENIERKKEDHASYSKKQKLFVEIYLKVLSLHEKLCEHFKTELGDSYVRSSLIQRARRGIRVMEEKNNFKFLSYYHFFKDLKPEQKQMLDQTIETQHK